MLLVSGLDDVIVILQDASDKSSIDSCNTIKAQI